MQILGPYQTTIAFADLMEREFGGFFRTTIHKSLEHTSGPGKVALENQGHLYLPRRHGNC
jgi:hypothetical protein